MGDPFDGGRSCGTAARKTAGVVCGFDEADPTYRNLLRDLV